MRFKDAWIMGLACFAGFILHEQVLQKPHNSRKLTGVRDWEANQTPAHDQVPETH